MRKRRILAFVMAIVLIGSCSIHTDLAAMASEEMITITSEETTTIVPEETTTAAPEETTTAASEETTTAEPEETTTTAPEETTTAALEETTTAASEETTTAEPEETTTAAPEETTTAAPEESTTQQGSGKTADTISPSVDKAIQKIAKYILKNDTNPDSGSTWFVISMVRSGVEVPQTYKDTYYKNVVKYLVENDWEITKSKYSEYSKLIMGLTAIGKDAQNIAGHNMLAYLSDFTNVKRQGFNGTLWALLALNCHDSYSIPKDSKAKEQTTEEGLITAILKAELSPGGWALYGSTPDADITGMAIQALSSYYGERSDVTKAVDRAVEWLSSAQLKSGGYDTMGTETAESAAQIITALSAIGIDCGEDQRFIKKGKWPLTGLMQYYLSNGTFEHIKGGGYNGLATAQGMYALVSYKRMLNGSGFTYHMSDITLKKGTLPKNLTSSSTSTSESNSGKKTDSTETDTTQYAASGTTKKLSKLTLSNTNNKSNTASGATTKGSSTGDTSGTNNTDNVDKQTIKSSTGWSFNGAEYVPEIAGEDTEEEETKEDRFGQLLSWIPDNLSKEEYMGLGAAALFGLEVVLIFLYILLKKRKHKIVEGEEKHE